MASIQTGIELQDNFTNVLYGIISSVDMAVSAMEDMRQTMNADIDTSGIEGARESINQTAAALDALNAAMASQTAPDIAPAAVPGDSSGQVINVDVNPILPDPLVENPDPIPLPVQPNAPPYVLDLPGQVDVPVSPVITEQPRFDLPEQVDVPVNLVEPGQQIEQIRQQLQGIGQMQQAISDVGGNAYVLPDGVSERIGEVSKEIQRLQAAVDYLQENPFNLDSSFAQLQIESLQRAITETIGSQSELNNILGNIPDQVINADVIVNNPEPVEVPVQWKSDGMEVFTGTGVGRFRQEVQSANSMLEQISSTQDVIARQAYNTSLFPPESFHDLNGLAVRIDNIGERIQQIENNPVNLGTDTANAELEQLRAQLNGMIQEQNELNEAVQNMDVSAANDAYLRLSQLVSGTEQYIRDNADEQGGFNEQIQEGISCAEELNSMISEAAAAFAGIFGVSEIIGFVSDGMDAFNTQLNAETQLMSVLANMLDDDYVSDYLIETAVTADSSDAVSEINGIQNDVNDVEITVGARTDALQAEFDSIIARADEISSNGIYGGDSLIAGAAELSTYFTDTDAVEMMMDTLSDYAMGMSGGGELDTAAMVEYATGLGKIMSGAYDAMTKKGFEFTEVQQDIIEGTATQEQIVAVLGKEYLNMSDDMQAAAVITQVIDESWAGLYETMSDTPEGKIIQLTSAWGDMKAMVAGQLYPYILLVVDTITSNWGTIQAVIDSFAAGLQNIMAVLSWLLGGVMNFASVVADNWSWISPVIYGIIGALAVYGTYLAITKGIEMASAAAKGVLAVAHGIQAAAIWATTSATWAETTAQLGLNSAMYACPIVWITLLIIALIAVIFAVCNVIAKMTDVANSGFGVMTGGINVVIQFFRNLGLGVANIALGIGNAIVAVAGNMMTAFHNAISSVQSWFYNLLSTALSVIAGICEALNKLPFVEFDYSGLTSAADDYAAKAAEAAGIKEDYQSVSEAFNNGFSTFETFQDGWVSDAFNAGAAWGDGIADAVSNFNLTDALGLDIGNAEDYNVSASDYSSMLNSDIGSGIDDIAGSTGSIADAMDITEEDLKYLRDIAEQEAVNRFTTAEIKVDMTNNNNITNGMDLDGVVSGLTDAVNEAIETMTEGVHD